MNRQGLYVRSQHDVQGYVTVSDRWQKVRMPLADFSMNGYHDYGDKEVRMPFNWDAIAQFEVVAGPCQEKEVAFCLDDIKIVAK